MTNPARTSLPTTHQKDPGLIRKDLTEPTALPKKGLVKKEVLLRKNQNYRH